MTVFPVSDTIAYLEEHCNFWKLERSNGEVSTERLDLTVRMGNFVYASCRRRQGESMLAFAKRTVAKALKDAPEKDDALTRVFDEFVGRAVDFDK